MVPCNYHGINFHVFFGLNICYQYKRACIVLSFYHKFNLYLYYSGYHELCIILTKAIVIFRD